MKTSIVTFLFFLQNFLQHVANHRKNHSRNRLLFLGTRRSETLKRKFQHGYNSTHCTPTQSSQKVCIFCCTFFFFFANSYKIFFTTFAIDSLTLAFFYRTRTRKRHADLNSYNKILKRMSILRKLGYFSQLNKLSRRVRILTFV